jgi:spore coat polysaccharide biosynthesis predicted glycosyltransferase SpsG
LLVAGALRARYAVVFASLDVPEYRYGHARITTHGYPLHLLPRGGYHDALRSLIRDVDPDFIACDLYEYDEEELKILEAARAPLMTFDHFGADRRYSDFPINAVSDPAQNPLEGPDYVVVPPPKVTPFREVPQNVFVCFGGYDHLDLTARVAGIMVRLGIGQRVHVVVSDIYPQVDALRTLTRQAHTDITIYQQPGNFEELLSDADIAFVSGGLTLFQALSLGVSVIVISQYEHQARTVSDFERYAAYVNLGQGDCVGEREITGALTRLIDHPGTRHTLRENARKLVDGKGLERIVRIVEGELEKSDSG